MFIYKVFAKMASFIVKKWVEFGVVFSVPVLNCIFWAFFASENEGRLRISRAQKNGGKPCTNVSKDSKAKVLYH